MDEDEDVDDKLHIHVILETYSVILFGKNSMTRLKYF